MSWYESRHPSRKSIALIELVNTNYRPALEYYSYRLSDRPKNYNDEVGKRVVEDGVASPGAAALASV